MLKQIAVIAAATWLTGCATIFEGGSQPLTFKSVPEAASITISNRAGEKIHNGTTPATVQLKRGNGYFRKESYTVMIEKPGYAPKQIEVTGAVNGWYFGNILFGGVIGMLIVDPATGAMYTLKPNTVEAALEAVQAQNWNEGERSLTVVLAESVPIELWAAVVPVQ